MPSRPLITRQQYAAAIEAERKKAQEEAEAEARRLEAISLEEEAARRKVEQAEREKAARQAQVAADLDRIARAEAQTRKDAIAARAQAKTKAQETLASNIAQLRTAGATSFNSREQLADTLAHDILIFEKPRPDSLTSAYESMKLFAYAVDGKLIDGTYVYALVLGDDVYEFNTATVLAALNHTLNDYVPTRYYNCNSIAKAALDLLEISTQHIKRGMTNARLLLCMGTNSTLDVKFIKDFSAWPKVTICVATDTG